MKFHFHFRRIKFDSFPIGFSSLEQFLWPFGTRHCCHTDDNLSDPNCNFSEPNTFVFQIVFIMGIIFLISSACASYLSKKVDIKILIGISFTFIYQFSFIYYFLLSISILFSFYFSHLAKYLLCILYINSVNTKYLPNVD